MQITSLLQIHETHTETHTSYIVSFFPLPFTLTKPTFQSDETHISQAQDMGGMGAGYGEKKMLILKKSGEYLDFWD